MAPELDLSGRTAIVTGAGRGLGKEIATTFGRAGANVVAAARTESEIDGVASEIASANEVETLTVPTDLRDEGDIENLVMRTVDELETPDVLVNNAGANIVNAPLEHSVEEVDAMLEVNLRGLFLLSQRFGEAFRSSSKESGRIVNVASIAGHVGVSQMTMYGGTKSGVYGITRGLASEFAPDSITVNSVSPGLTRVERTEQVIDEKADDVFELDRIPLGRVGRPSDVANACLFLASDLAEYVTGEDLLVDGGAAFTAGLYK